MKYYFYDVDSKSGEPAIRILKAYGFRRKNNMDQVFAKIDNRFKWIFAKIVKET